MSLAVLTAAPALLAAGPGLDGAPGGEPALAAGEGWRQNGLVTARFEIQGTGGRSNPLRRPLASPFSGDQLFVRYRINYDAGSIDLPSEDKNQGGGDGEFFVLWLDEAEGGEAATHSGGVPNLGIHVSQGENRFMARFAPGGERFGAPLEGDREFLLVGRLWKSTPGPGAPFDQLDLWVDPSPEAEFSPNASAKSAKAIAAVKWVGFSTGAKTEPGDRIAVWDVEVTATWEGILGLPPKPEPSGNAAPAPVAAKTVRFREHVFPILEARCFKCHEGEDAKEGVRLDLLDEVFSQARLGEVLAGGEMPPEGKGEPLTKKEVATLQAWIAEGLDWDEELLPSPVPQTSHWAFQPIRRPEIPRVRRADWGRNPVDAFIARRHEELGLEPAPEAEAAVLQRRLSLDLLGLPPKPGETRTVDEMLDDPAYGERWARHWLDVARWAESNGHQHNRERPHAWRYRDYVVDAFNADKPFDRFILEQIAGDELDAPGPEAVVATGFLAAARYSGNELDKEIQRNDILADVVNTTGNAFLGLTLECAQCHTHKFDPVSIRDYYRLQAFFARGQPGNVVLPGRETVAAKLIEERWRIFDAVHARLVAIKRKQGHPEPVYVIPKSVIAGMRGEEKARFEELERAIAKLPQSWSYWSAPDGATALPVAPHMMRWPLPRDPAVLANLRTRVLIRGDVTSPGPEVEPGWPAVFGPTPPNLEKPRTALARWLANPENPLTARVWANRIWQWHFGRGLVESSGDFGTQGTEPSHPELLDFLASELIASGWRTKHLHRLIVESATYRQSSRFSETNAALDPENRALWRWEPRRLEAEAIRDSILAVSGQLDPARGGPSVAETAKRRSLYLRQQRDRFPGQQMLFDSANGMVSCSRRRVSTTALQPLWLLNSGFVQEAAAGLARRAGSVEEAVRLALHREPLPGEADELRTLAEKHGFPSACLVLLNSSEFLYLP